MHYHPARGLRESDRYGNHNRRDRHQKSMVIPMADVCKWCGKHCKPCLKGYTSKKITKWTRHEENVCLDESEAKYYYLCGGSYPYIWKNNFHLAWKEKSGASFEYSFNGITIRLKNAERVEFSQDDIEKTQKYADRPEYYTCRNWQFANKVKYAIDLEEASEKMNEEKRNDNEVLDDRDFFEDLEKIFKEQEEKSMKLYLDIWEEYLIEMDDEELNEDYRQYLKENNINREWDK